MPLARRLLDAYTVGRSAYDAQRDRKRQDEADRAAEAEAEEAKRARALQMAALLANLGEQGIMAESDAPTMAVDLPGVGQIGESSRGPSRRVDTGIVDRARFKALGESGYVQDTTRTKRAMEQRAATDRATTMRQRVATLRALDPTLRGASDDALMALAEDEGAFRDRVQFRKPDVATAKPPTRGTPEYNRMLTDEEKARIAARGPKALPTSAIEKFEALENLTKTATEARDALKNAIANKVNATGRAGGVMPMPSWVKDKKLSGMGSDAAKDVRIALGAMFSDVAKLRGGSALSASEIALLERFLPNEDDDEATNLIKANRFLQTLKRLMETKESVYRKYGAERGGVVDETDLDAGLPNP